MTYLSNASLFLYSGYFVCYLCYICVVSCFLMRSSLLMSIKFYLATLYLFLYDYNCFIRAIILQKGTLNNMISTLTFVMQIQNQVIFIKGFLNTFNFFI